MGLGEGDFERKILEPGYRGKNCLHIDPIQHLFEDKIRRRAEQKGNRDLKKERKIMGLTMLQCGVGRFLCQNVSKVKSHSASSMVWRVY